METAARPRQQAQSQEGSNGSRVLVAVVLIATA